MLKVTLVVCCSVYTVLVLSAITNQRCLSLSMTYGNSKLSYAVYRSAYTDSSYNCIKDRC